MNQTLPQLRALLADPDHWIKEVYARSAQALGMMVEPTNPNAKCFCLAGGLCRVLELPTSGADYNPEFKQAGQLLTKAATELFPDRTFSGHNSGYVNFNDDPETTHDDILAVIDAALAQS